MMMMPMTPKPTDKLDATTLVVVSGPADDPLANEQAVGPRAIRPDRLA